MIGIFVNTTAGKGKALKITSILNNYLTKNNIEFVIYKDNWPTEINTITEAWVVGGDGTVNYFLNKYPSAKMAISVFKGGTGNDFGWKLYGDMSLQQQIELVVNATPKKVDAAICNNKIFINSVGVGFDGEVLKSMKSIRWLGGHLGYLFVVIKKIFSFKEFNFSIESSTLNITQKFLLVNIANSVRTGGGFYISPLADVTDGELNIVLCKPLSILKRLRYLPVIEKGKHLALPFIAHHLTQQIIIQMPQNVFAQLDGELIEGKQFDIKILKEQFNFKY
jgi:diacylglycerol kinase family enzyme